MNYSGITTAVLAISLSTTATACGKPAGKVFSRDRYLLLDSRIIESTENAQLTVGVVRKDKNNPLFKEDKPWEPRFDNLYANVLYDRQEKLYKCWYSPFIVDRSARGMTLQERESKRYASPNDREMGVCYAVSKDGIKWTKPELGLVEFNGDSKNNIVQRGPHGTGIFKDLREPDPARRYKVLFKKSEGDNRMSAAFSADGLRWSKAVQLRTDARGDTHCNAFWAPAIGKYVAFARLKSGGLRLVARIESPDFLRWTKGRVVLKGLSKDLQTYSMPAFPYGGVYIGLPAIYNTKTDRVQTELAWSPDSVKWHRICPGAALIPNSEKKGAYDWGTVYAAAHPIVREKEIRIYYGGCDGPHYGWREGFLCLARLRPDGFAGYEQIAGGGNKTATVTTRPVVAVGDSLRVSADAGVSGYVKVTACDKGGRELAEGELMSKSVTDAEVQWTKGFSLGKLKGKYIRLKFELRDAKLYSFSFE